MSRPAEVRGNVHPEELKGFHRFNNRTSYRYWLTVATIIMQKINPHQLVLTRVQLHVVTMSEAVNVIYKVFRYRYGKKVTTTVLYTDENFLWSGFYCNRSRHGNVMTPLHFSFIFVFLCSRSFLKKSLKGVCTCYNCLHYGIVWTNSMRAFLKYFEM